MAQLRLTLFFIPALADDELVRVVANPARNESIQAANVIFAGPHPNPRIVSIYVPTPETHWVTIYRTPDEETVGVQVSRYQSMPVYYNSVFIEDIVIVTGRGTQTDPSNSDIIIDPVAGETEVIIPFLSGKPVARIFSESRSRFLRPGEYSLVSADGENSAFRLTDGSTFYDGDLGGEGFRISFAPYYENNTGQAIFDLTTQLTAHIADTDNPHSVTKAQVGLNTIPNAITDSYQENDGGKLATAKAVYDLWQASVSAKIIASKSVFIGNVGAVTVGGDITSAVNSGNESKVTITHNLGIIGSYMVWPVVQGRSTGSTSGTDNWKLDNDVIVTVGNSIDQNKFELFVSKPSAATTAITVFYMLVKMV